MECPPAPRSPGTPGGEVTGARRREVIFPCWEVWSQAVKRRRGYKAGSKVWDRPVEGLGVDGMISKVS